MTVAGTRVVLQRRSLRIAPFLLLTTLVASSSWVHGSSSCAAVSNLLVPGPGLKNLGNTCYLNAQLQCAYHIPLVRRLILTRTIPSNVDPIDTAAAEDPAADDDGDNNNQEESIALQALRIVFRDMQTSQNEANLAVVSPSILCETLGIPVMVQQDSQEFWKLLLPALQCKPISDLYQGAFEDYIIALDGSGRERRREEAFLDLSLEITTTTPTSSTSSNGRSSSVSASLEELFGKPELLSQAEGNGWRPEKGADKVDAHKGSILKLQGLPSILQLHLKRFQYDWNTDTTSKLNDPFSFPVELDLSSLCKQDDSEKSNSQDLAVYDLQAVVVHAGEYGSGHYYAYVRPDVTKDVWYRFNDDIVTQVSLEDVLKDAYGGKTAGSAASTERKGRGGLLSRIKRALHGGDLYGYGGRTSNAYVLQYIRRNDISMLYEGATID